MEASIINAVIAGVVGLITGAVGSLVAPWIQWGIEKRRKRYERRVELIKQWRELALSETFDREEFVKHPCYGPLQDLLKKEVREQLENLNILTGVDAGPKTPFGYFQKPLLEEINRIEKAWDLV